MAKHAHLVKVMVQTVWVVVDDDTGNATEMADQGVAVPAADWPTFHQNHATEFRAIQDATAAGESQLPEPAPKRPARLPRKQAPRG